MNSNDSFELMTHWLTLPIGQYLIQKESAYFNRAVRDIFGFKALQYDFLMHNFLKENRISQHLFAAPHARSSNAHFICDANALPIDCDSLDLLIMPHVLDFNNDIEGIFNEAERVLAPEGHFILTGFNPLSLWGILKKLRPQHVPWTANFFPLSTVQRALFSKTFQMSGGAFFAYAPPICHERLLNSLHPLELAGDRWWPHMGAVYALEVVKRPPSMRPICLKFSSPLTPHAAPISNL